MTQNIHEELPLIDPTKVPLIADLDRELTEEERKASVAMLDEKDKLEHAL
jgi:hypothetical protein